MVLNTREKVNSWVMLLLFYTPNSVSAGFINKTAVWSLEDLFANIILKYIDYTYVA